MSNMSVEKEEPEIIPQPQPDGKGRILRNKYIAFCSARLRLRREDDDGFSTNIGLLAEPKTTGSR